MSDKGLVSPLAMRLLDAPVPPGVSPAARFALIADLHAAGLLGPPPSRWQRWLGRWFRCRMWLAEKLLRALRIEPTDLVDEPERP